MTWSPFRSGDLPQVSPGTGFLLLLVALGVAWATGLLRPHYDGGSLALLTPSPLTTGGTMAAIRTWLLALPSRTNTLLLLSLLLMFVATGLWTSWWVFFRRNGLVALLPSGTILAVEIINDTSPSL